MKLAVNLESTSYDIELGEGILHHLKDYFDTDKKIFILSDTGVPNVWIDMVHKQCPNSMVYTVSSGETSKSIQTYEEVLQACLDFKMTRQDMIIALGGGVIGDLAGFVASSYMRGIKYISIPTTSLSQIDSSIGGKVAINLGKVKNIVGAFYHPSLVLIDFKTLSTLPKRHLISGLVEALKAGLICDPSLYEYFRNNTYMDHLDDVIYKALFVKKMVVEKDEKEQHLRKILNFGHTIGHAIESYYNLETYYHGECVAMGMLYFIKDKALRKEVKRILDMMELPNTPNFDVDAVYNILTLDKKAHADRMSVIEVNKIGKADIVDIKTTAIKALLEDY